MTLKQTHRFSVRLPDGVWKLEEFTVEVDLALICGELARRAFKSKSKKATALHGAVSVTHVPSLPLDPK